jgi:hypothetical protein
MDQDTFVVVESGPPVDDFLSKHRIIVDGRLESTSTNSLGVLSSPTSRSIAIVDRTSVISEAARDIIRARLAFCGRSPYAPDLVLVNEFVLDEFCIAAIRHVTERFGTNLPRVNTRKAKSETTSDLRRELQESGARSLVSGSGQCIAIVEDR